MARRGGGQDRGPARDFTGGREPGGCGWGGWRGRCDTARKGKSGPERPDPEDPGAHFAESSGVPGTDSDAASLALPQGQAASWQACLTSIDALDDILFHGAEWPHLSHTVPGIGRARFATDGLVAFEETGHEEFPGQGGELDAAPGAVGDEVIGFGGVDHARA